MSGNGVLPGLEDYLRLARPGTNHGIAKVFDAGLPPSSVVLPTMIPNLEIAEASTTCRRRWI